MRNCKGHLSFVIRTSFTVQYLLVKIKKKANFEQTVIQLSVTLNLHNELNVNLGKEFL